MTWLQPDADAELGDAAVDAPGHVAVEARSIVATHFMPANAVTLFRAGQLERAGGNNLPGVHCLRQNPFGAAAMTSKFITVDPEIHSGTPVFAGTRVPVKTLFDHLEAGDSIEVFLDDFPSVSRDLAVAVLEDARAALVTGAHPA